MKDSRNAYQKMVEIHISMLILRSGDYYHYFSVISMYGINSNFKRIKINMINNNKIIILTAISLSITASSLETNFTFPFPKFLLTHYTSKTET